MDTTMLVLLIIAGVLLLAGFVVGLVFLIFFLVKSLGGSTGGWGKLAEVYGTPNPPSGQITKGETIQVGAVTYKRCVTLALYVGLYTICNLNGQMLNLVGQGDVAKQLASLGPDAMAQPYPADEIRAALAASRLPISEALLDQSVLAGVGNIAKSEILFQTRLDPRVAANEVKSMDRLLESTRKVLWASYHAGGRWVCQVYHRHGQRCEVCGSVIRSVRLAPSKRATYFCPSCQR